MAVLKETSKIPGGFDFTILNHYFLIYIIDTSIKAQKTCIKTCIASINISLESHIRVNETLLLAKKITYLSFHGATGHCFIKIPSSLNIMTISLSLSRTGI